VRIREKIKGLEEILNGLITPSKKSPFTNKILSVNLNAQKQKFEESIATDFL